MTNIDKLIRDNTWQDIKEIPTDGTDVMLKRGDEVEAGWIDMDDFDLNDTIATHFRPLPDNRCAAALRASVDTYGSILAGLKFLLTAVEEGDPKREIVGRVSQLINEINEINALNMKLEQMARGDG